MTIYKKEWCPKISDFEWATAILHGKHRNHGGLEYYWFNNAMYVVRVR